MKLKHSVCLMLMVAFFISCKNKSSTVQHEQKTTVFQNIIDSILQLNPQSIGLMVHIESPKNGISWSGSSGVSDKEKNTPIHSLQPALIASSIKSYISASILKLQEEGTLDIEDSIAKHLTQKTANLFREDGYDLDAIKIKHLLSHTSGINDYVNDAYFQFIDNNPKYRWTRDEQLARTVKVADPIGQVQEQFKYADANFLLATEIIEQRTGKPFYEAMHELLEYEKLGFKNTWFPTLEDKPENSLDLVHQYWNEADWGPQKMDINWDSYDHDISWDLYGGGGIATNMKELAQFGYHLFNHHIIEDQALLDLMITDVPTSDGIPKIYRLGIADAQVKGLQSLGHGGFWGTMFFYIPALDASIAVCVLERQGKMNVIRPTLNSLTAALTEQLHPFEVKHSTEDYNLYKVKNAVACLILFPGGGNTAAETKEEFDILTAAAANKISVVFMNFNRHLWIDESTSKELANSLETLVSEHSLNSKNIFIGGMSIGGNVALSLSDYLMRQSSTIRPHGTFIVDSPIDLYSLYESAHKDINTPGFNEDRLAEPKWIIEYFEQAFSKDSLLQNIAKVSPFTQESNSNMIGHLQTTNLRFYTEPDSVWWKENRQTDFEDTNAYNIQKISETLKNQGWEKLEYIETQGKGYRSNGDRHPHSWSIVDVRDLIEWILK